MTQTKQRDVGEVRRPGISRIIEQVQKEHPTWDEARVRAEAKRRWYHAKCEEGTPR